MSYSDYDFCWLSYRMKVPPSATSGRLLTITPLTTTLYHMNLISSTKLPRRDDLDSDESIGAILLIANDRYIAQSLSDRTIHVLSSDTGVLQRTLVHPISWCSGLALDNENIVITSSKDANLRVYNILSGHLLHTLLCSNQQNVYHIASAHKGNTGIVVGFHLDGSASVWDVRAGVQLHTLKLHEQHAFKTEMVGDLLVTSSPDGTVAAWDCKNGLLVWKHHPGEPEPTTGLTRAGNGVFALKVGNGKVAAGLRNGHVWIWDLSSGIELAAWHASNSMIKNLEFHDDWLLHSSGGEVGLWSMDTYQRVHSLQLFGRSCDTIGVLNGTIISCGRDASTAIDNDVCGLDEGVKGWRFPQDKIWDQGSREDKKEAAESSLDEVPNIHQQVFRIGAPTLQARGLVVLNDKVAISVMRRGTWAIEIWTKG